MTFEVGRWLWGAKARALVLLAVTGMLLMVFRAEGSMEQHFIYFPDREMVVTPSHLGFAFEDVAFLADDGVRLHGWFLPGSPDKPVVLFFHGNAGNISHRVENLAYLNRLGLGVFIFDYRGYGRSGGRPDEEGLARDARAAQRWLDKRSVPSRQTVYFGRSLGAAVALQLALEVPPAGLVLETPFTSIQELGRKHYPLLHTVLGWLVSDRYANIDKIPTYRGPLLIFQGDRDSIVPEEMARRLFDAANEPKRLYLIHGANHNDTYEVGGEAYWKVWSDFIGALSQAKSFVPEDAPPGGKGASQ